MMKAIKFTGLLLAFSLLYLLAACASDDSEDPVPAHPDFSFREPVTLWGSSQEDVQLSMSGYSLLQQGQYSLVFEGRESEQSYLYAFSGSPSGLSYAVVAFDISLLEQVTSFVEGRYHVKATSEGKTVYTDASQSTNIIITSDTALYLTYMSASR